MHERREWLFAHDDEELREVHWIHYGRYLHERAQGKPTQYITKRQEFYGRDFRVTPDVLIPRPETELLVEAVLAYRAGRIVDVGAGSGAIAITLALETGAEIIATDISSAALAIAAANAAQLGAEVRFLQTDLLSALADSSVDVVASNPPYVAEADRATMQREVRDWEPELALFAGRDGLAIYRRLIPEAWRVLRQGGHLALEIGFGQRDAVAEIARNWTNPEIRNDLAGIPRVLLVTKPQ
jgi:release factor glutamine methyltransferase